jgi:hypothetical protein
MMKHVTAVVIIAAAAGALSLGAAERKATGHPGTQATSQPAVNPPNLGSGTISYDNNVPFARRGDDGGTVGNNFNTAVDPHGVSTATFRIAGNYGTAPGAGAQMVMSFWDVNPGSFMILFRDIISGLPYIPYPPNANTVTMFTNMAPLTMPIVAHTGAFVGGLRNTDYAACAGNVALNTTCDGVALTMGGVDPGMGFHGIRVPFNSASFLPTITMVAGAGTSFATQNAIFRVTGDNLPVELMNFGVE